MVISCLTIIDRYEVIDMHETSETRLGQIMTNNVPCMFRLHIRYIFGSFCWFVCLLSFVCFLLCSLFCFVLFVCLCLFFSSGSRNRHCNILDPRHFGGACIFRFEVIHIFWWNMIFRTTNESCRLSCLALSEMDVFCATRDRIEWARDRHFDPWDSLCAEH